MYLQGNLQLVFDALFDLGVIEPVLEMDWNLLKGSRQELQRVIEVVNRYQNNSSELIYQLERFDQYHLSCLAMEVAREFADYHSRESLH